MNSVLSFFDIQNFIANNTINMVVVTDAKHRIEWVNKTFEEKTGYQLKEIIGLNPQFLQGPHPHPHTNQQIRKQLNSLEPFSATLLNFSKQGRPYWVRMDITPIRNEKNEVIHFIAIETDITEEKIMEQQIAQQHKLLRRMFDMHIIPTCYLDAEGKIIRVNPAYCQFYGLAESELINKSFLIHFEHLPEEEKAGLMDNFKNFVIQGGYETCEYEVRINSGEMKTVEAIRKKINLEGQLVVSIFVIDITEKRSYEKHILDQYRRLSEFIFSISHQLRAPLCNILGVSNILIESDVQAHPVLFKGLLEAAHKLDVVLTDMVKTLEQNQMEDLNALSKSVGPTLKDE